MSRWTRRDENAGATAATKRRWKRSYRCRSPSNTYAQDSPWPPCNASADSGATPKPHAACNNPSTSSLSNCARQREKNTANQSTVVLNGGLREASQQRSEARRLKRRPLASRSIPRLKTKTIPAAARLLSQINAERSHHLLAFSVSL